MKRWLVAAMIVLAAAPVLAQTASQPSQAAQWVNGIVQGCWVCGAFNVLSAIGLSFADQAFQSLSSAMTLLIGLLMALWILLFAAKMVLPFGPEGGAASWNQGAKKLFRLVLVLAFLQGSGPFWSYVFIPLISAGMGVAGQMATATDGFEAQFGSSESPPNGAVDYCAAPPPTNPVNGLSANSTAAASAMAQMDCPLSRIQSQFAKGIVIGAAAMAQGTCSAGQLFPSLQGLGYTTAGLAMIAAFLFGYLVFPFLLIDVVMRVSLVAATAPLLIAGTLFGPTAKMAERALWTLAQCCLTLIFGAALAGIGKATIAYILANLPQTGSQSLSNWQTLTTALEQPCSAGLSIGFFSASFYMLIGTAVMLIYLIRRAGHLASEITHVAADGVGAQAAAAFMVGRALTLAGRGTQRLIGRRSPAGNAPRSSADEVSGRQQKP